MLTVAAAACGGDDGHAKDSDPATGDERDAGAVDAGKRDAGKPATGNDASVIKHDASTPHDAAVSSVDASARDASMPGDAGADSQCVDVACTTFLDCVLAHPTCGLTACTNQRCTK